MYITLEGLIGRLQEIAKKHPKLLGKRVALDTEACTYNAHLYEISSAHPMTELGDEESVTTVHLEHYPPHLSREVDCDHSYLINNGQWRLSLHDNLQSDLAKQLQEKYGSEALNEAVLGAASATAELGRLNGPEHQVAYLMGVHGYDEETLHKILEAYAEEIANRDAKDEAETLEFEQWWDSNCQRIGCYAEMRPSDGKYFAEEAWEAAKKQSELQAAFATVEQADITPGPVFIREEAEVPAALTSEAGRAIAEDLRREDEESERTG